MGGCNNEPEKINDPLLEDDPIGSALAVDFIATHHRHKTRSSRSRGEPGPNDSLPWKTSLQ
jgi:hypothetical protein